MRALIKLSKTTGLFPQCLVLHGLDLHTKEPRAAGRFGDVWREELQGLTIAVKVARTYQNSEAMQISKVCLYGVVRDAEQVAFANARPFHARP